MEKISFQLHIYREYSAHNKVLMHLLLHTHRAEMQCYTLKN